MEVEIEIKEALKEKGADIVRIVDISGLDCEQTQGFPTAVLFIMALSKDYILDVYNDVPLAQPDDFVDKEHKCDELADWLADFIRQKGYGAYSQSEDSNDENGQYDEAALSSVLPHKTIARLAGLGFIGKNDLLVTDEYGCAVSMCSVLTDAPLRAELCDIKPPGCGECGVCREACNAGAIYGKEWTEEGGREGIIDVYKCDPCGKCMTNCPASLEYAGLAAQDCMVR